MVEDIDIIHIHPLEALVKAGNQVFFTAPVAVGSGPHVIARLRGKDKLVAVRLPIPLHVDAEIALGFSVGRAVVVGQVKMGDAVVKCRAQDVALCAEGRDVAEIMP